MLIFSSMVVSEEEEEEEKGSNSGSSEDPFLPRCDQGSSTLSRHRVPVRGTAHHLKGKKYFACMSLDLLCLRLPLFFPLRFSSFLSFVFSPVLDSSSQVLWDCREYYEGMCFHLNLVLWMWAFFFCFFFFFNSFHRLWWWLIWTSLQRIDRL